MSNSLYDTDFAAWTAEQARLLRDGRLADLDSANVAEEIESMGRREQDELTNRLAVLLTHLLKWHFQPDWRTVGWILTIEEQRRQIARNMGKSPSLKPLLPQILADAYGDALIAARQQTGLPKAAFPAVCPWTFDDAMTGEPTEAPD
jgi:hypothetical protein